MVEWKFNVRPEDRISVENLRSKLKWSSVEECVQDRRLQWFGPVERMLGLVTVEPSRLVVVSLGNDIGKHGMR